MDSSASYDISSSAAEFLEKEKHCKELCQNINEGIQPGGISISTPRDLTRTPDEEISDLLKQMNEFLSPRDRDAVKSSEEKSVENLLKEAEELIRSSTPLFLNMTFDSSEKSLKSPAKNNNNNNVPNITTPKKTKSAIPLVEEDTASVTHQPEDTDQVANKNTEDDRNNNKSDDLKSDRITKENNNKNLIKDVEKENNKNLQKDEEVNSNNKSDNDGLVKANNSHNNESSQLSSATTINNSQQSVSANPLLEYNIQLFKEIGDKRKKKQSPVATSPFRKSTKEIQNIEKLTLSDLATPVASGHLVMRMESNKRSSPMKSKEITPGACCEEQKKKNMELDKIRKHYEEKIFDLEQQINILNAKLKDYEYEALKVNANISESAKNQHQVELLENELRTQEQLIAGYQRENHKLCQEISACKLVKKKKKKMLYSSSFDALKKSLVGVQKCIQATDLYEASQEAVEEKLRACRQ